MKSPPEKPALAVIGGGPAGLMGAEVLAAAGHSVHCFDAMPTVGRKLLMAGKSGLNLTHTEDQDIFLTRYGAARDWLQAPLTRFSPADLRVWAAGLGVATFVGSSGRVFPDGMKAAPLLRAWVRRLRGLGVRFHLRHRWLGWQEKALLFATPEATAPVLFSADAVLLALGGASWARLGSDGVWANILAAEDIPLAPFRPANCGFDVDWSPVFRTRYAGEPVKTVRASVAASAPGFPQKRGDFVITETGIEGSLIYAFAAPLRDALEQTGAATLTLDLLPDQPLERLAAALARPQGRDSLANHLRRRAGLTGVKAALARELLPPEILHNPSRLAAALKSLSLPVLAPRPLDEAISSAGGIRREALDARLMLKTRPGIFCAGEMLDWEAPTGGYLLTACLATGRAAGEGMLAWLGQQA
ncbi:MAG: TIGR03862 family flavoprotein [Zoogloeaceae bacterium]|jgi:uncharacterized flavoprotein (TIGR03862 family)|nr:TIGR03862 family flavoprotein [Zoogloeaceae bacterium]